MSRGSLTMRATIQRSAVQPTDPWGRPEPPIFGALPGEVPCRVWSHQRKELRTDGVEAVIDDLRAIVPATADVREGDRLVIRNRMDAVLYGGPLAVQTSALRAGPASRVRHRELVLTRHL